MAVTLNEATVLMDRHIPVSIDGYSGVHYIESINKFTDKHLHQHVYSYAVSKNGRCVFTVSRESISALPEFENNLNILTTQYKRKILKNCVKVLVQDGSNKTTITKIVKDLIDEIKQENKQ